MSLHWNELEESPWLLFQMTLCRELRPGNGILHLRCITMFLPQIIEVKRWIAKQVWTARPIKPLLKRNPKQQQELRYYKASFSEVFHYTWLSSWAEVQKYQCCLIHFSEKQAAWIRCTSALHWNRWSSAFLRFSYSNPYSLSYMKVFFQFLAEARKQTCELWTKISQRQKDLFLSSSLFTPGIPPHFMMCSKEHTKTQRWPQSHYEMPTGKCSLQWSSAQVSSPSLCGWQDRNTQRKPPLPQGRPSQVFSLRKGLHANT